ncbi:MAG: O-antigen ligase family protein [Mariprofundaceae bacterium]|nr:O-antigen ligase family protein [Mariprofundaceae bacterium]
MALLSSCIIFLTFHQRNSISSPKIYTLFLTASIIWASLALFVWVGGTNGNALHLGLWALTSDAGIKPNGPFVNGNVLAIFNACAWLIATVCAMKTQRWWWWVLAFFFLCCVSISMAWGAWLAILPILLWLLIYCLSSKKYRLFSAVLLSVVMAWCAGQVMVQYMNNHDPVGAEVRIKNTSEHGIAARKLIWLSSYKMWQDHPWFGVGLGNMSAHYLTYQSKVLAESKEPLPEQVAVNSAHNILLQLLAEGGLLGLLLWLTITGWLVVLSWRYRMRIMTSRAWPALACAWLLWIQGMGNITLSRPYPILMFALFLGLASAASLRHTANVIVVKKQMVMLLLIPAIAYLAWASVDKTQAWLDYERLSFSHISANEQAALAQSLVKEPTVLPYLIGDMIGDRPLHPDTQKSALLLEPYLQQALKLRQDPRLLQQQFYIHVLNKRWEKACDIATILRPMKSQQANQQALIDACNKKMPKAFAFH